MTGVVPLAGAEDHGIFGSKAVGLGEAARGGLDLPPGVALSGSIVEAVAAGDATAIETVIASVDALPCPLAVRSSAVDEDGVGASFAGQHLTLLNVPSSEGVTDALREIWWSANSDSAIGYRKRSGVMRRPSVGVVVQSLLDPDVAGVMFTRNPISGADEVLVEASWGLGEAVVAGRVIPDSFRIARTGEVLARTPGRKQIAIRPTPDGGTVDDPVPADRQEVLCLDDERLAALAVLAERCEGLYGPARDIEWAFAGGALYVLQCRPMTTGARPPHRPPDPPVESMRRVPLFAELDESESRALAGLMKERRFARGQVVVQEGSDGSAFFIIESGRATVLVQGQERATLEHGDAFGELALIDGGSRSATVVAATDLVCFGITVWDFRPLLEQSPQLSWKIMQSLVRMLRASRAGG